MTSFIGRRLRLQLVAGLGIALALPAFALAAETSQALATSTTLAAETHTVNGSTQATVSVAVTNENGTAVSGSVVIEDNSQPLAGVALRSDGRATTVLTLGPGSHSLTAVYTGTSASLSSTSQASVVAAAATATPDFGIAVSPATLSLTQGQSGTVTVSVTPSNASALTAPLFITVSCSGLPDQSKCSFTPASVEILPNATSALTSSLVISTVGSNTARLDLPPAARRTSPITWALLLPGALGFASLAFGARRRAWLSRLSLLGLLAVLTMLGTTGCNPLYNYENHGPSANLPTPTGTYTITIAGQSSNGVTATTHTTSLALTVK